MGNVTTVYVARMATRHLSAKDPSSMSPGQKAELIEAINAALFEYFEEADDNYKRTTATELLLAPVERSVTIESSATTVTGNPFLASERGKSILIPDDPDYNEIVATNQLLRPFRGTGGTVTATIYSDAVAIRNFQVERIVTDPKIVDHGRRLIYEDRDQVAEEGNIFYRATASRQLGDPVRYSVAYVGGSLATGDDDAVMVIFIDPIPTAALTIEFDILIRAATFGIEALESPSYLPIDRSVFSRQFLPLVEFQLMRSSMWAGTDLASKMILEEYGRATGSIQKLADEFAKPRRSIGTRRGF